MMLRCLAPSNSKAKIKLFGFRGIDELTETERDESAKREPDPRLTDQFREITLNPIGCSWSGGLLRTSVSDHGKPNEVAY